MSITLAPSLRWDNCRQRIRQRRSVAETLTIKKHGGEGQGSVWWPPTTLSIGSYFTLATVVVGTDTVNATAPGTYKLTLPPAPTTTPSLIGHYFGLVHGSTTLGNGGTINHVATIIWQTTAQDLTSLTGTFSVGAGQTAGTMIGSENTTGAIQYALTSDTINYTFKGKVSPDGSTITGVIHGTLVNNIFKRIDGHVKLTLQTS